MSLAMQLSTLRQPRVISSNVFCPQLRVLLVACVTERLIIRNIISPALPRSFSVSVFVNTTIQGSAWPSGRLHFDYMPEVFKMAALDPVHNV